MIIRLVWVNMHIKQLIWDIAYSLNFLAHLGIVLVFAAILFNEMLTFFPPKKRKKDV